MDTGQTKTGWIQFKYPSILQARANEKNAPRKSSKLMRKMLQVRTNEKNATSSRYHHTNICKKSKLDWHDDIIMETVPGIFSFEGFIEGPRISCSFKLHIIFFHLFNKHLLNDYVSMSCLFLLFIDYGIYWKYSVSVSYCWIRNYHKSKWLKTIAIYLLMVLRLDI